jgi:monoamine oxidase
MSINRRKFIQHLLALGAVSILPSWSKPARAQGDNSADVIVVGAGAAGLSAAQYLQSEGYTVIVLEARDRVGGRALTNLDFLDHPVEMGAEFIEGEQVATWDYVEAFNANTIEDAIGSDDYVYDGRGLRADYTDYAEELDEAAEARSNDEKDAALSVLARELYRGEEYQLANNALASEYGADLAQLGIVGFGEATYKGDISERQYRLRDGYTALFQRLGRDLNMIFSNPVDTIEYDAEGAAVYTLNGDQYEASRVIITLPLGVLRNGDVTFDPPLPERKQQAIDGLGIGNSMKMILRFDELFWDDQLSSVLTVQRTQYWWRPGWGRRTSTPALTALIGGDAANDFMRMGSEAALDLALRDLTDIFGRDPKRHLNGTLFMAWQNEAYTRMGYSYVPVNGGGLRARLAAPVGDVLFFAGEATNVDRAATVHGAIESGWRAADEVIESLG